MLGYDFSVELWRARSHCLHSVPQPQSRLPFPPTHLFLGGPGPHGVVCVIKCMGDGSSLLDRLLAILVLAFEFVATPSMGKVARGLSSWSVVSLVQKKCSIN